MRWFALALLCAAAVGCGPTVGDGCTTASDCENQLCINQDFAPGGYCSKTCDPTKNDCPTGSVCVADALGHGAPACFRTCAVAADCRDSYACRTTHESPLICVGPSGI